LTDKTVEIGLRLRGPVSRVLGPVLLLPLLICFGTIVVFAVYAVYGWITEDKSFHRTFSSKPIQLPPTVEVDYGFRLINQGWFVEAERVLRECLERYQADLPKSDWRIGRVTSLLGESLARQEKFEEAEPLLLEGYATLSQLADDFPRIFDQARQRLVELYEAWGHPEQADPYRVAESVLPPSSPIPPNQTRGIASPESMMAYYRNPANAAAQADGGFKLRGQGRPAEAEKVFRSVLKTRQAGLPIGHWQTGYATNLIGLSLALQEKFEEAEPFLLNGYATMKGDPKANPLRVDEARLRIVWFYEAWGKPEKAEAFRVTQADSAQVPGEPTP